MQRNVDALRDGTFDLLIVGGGITGAGVALDASLRGFRVALIDKGDFASGTSSASSKLVHGGIRYLEHGDFPLVYEALHERGRLLENAPHIVHPLRFVIPFHAGARVPAWKWRVGLTLYDLLAGTSNVRRSRPLPLRSLRREEPWLLPEGLRGGAAYFDAQMDDARLCIEVMQSASAEGANVANYVEAVALDRTGARVVDRRDGTEFTIRARQVVNAAGPWVDALCKRAGDSSGPYLKPSKGVHLIAEGRGLTSAFLLLHPADGRVFFVIPWLGKTLVGTTDTFDADGPDRLAVTDADVAYLLEGHNRYLTPALERRDVLGAFAGLRPLIASRPGDPSALSREFRLIESPGGLISVAGGKYTTYRRMAEVVTDAVARRLRRTRRGRTARYRLNGTPRQPWADFRKRTAAELSARHGLSEPAARHLVGRYGRRAVDVASYLKENPEGAVAVVPGEPDLRVEFAYQRDHEMALESADFLLRRTRLGLFHPHLLKAPFTGGGRDHS